MRMFLAAACVAAILGAAAAPAADIVRHQLTPPGLILQSATVPAGAEMLYLSGQLASPIDPAKKPAPGAPLTRADYGDTKTQTISALTNMKQVLAERGYKMSDVITMMTYLAADPELGGKLDTAGYNEGFKMFFKTAENPETVTRASVQVAALVNPALLVEIVVVAAKNR
ncbi:Rid family hydrolase [Sphingomonas bacterium]|uniref:Rid family hydrolase n=1 Tax=Sphingomonas bacterium TaxID=1895847 RepID=UPI001576C60E|nr:Rid family hydrolase [Sphingomonas bacterium]